MTYRLSSVPSTLIISATSFVTSLLGGTCTRGVCASLETENKYILQRVVTDLWVTKQISIKVGWELLVTVIGCVHILE